MVSLPVFPENYTALCFILLTLVTDTLPIASLSCSTVPLSKLPLLPVYPLLTISSPSTSISLNKSTSLLNPSVSFFNSTHRKKKNYIAINFVILSSSRYVQKLTIHQSHLHCADALTTQHLPSSQTITFFIPGLLILFLAFVILHFWSLVYVVFFITLAGFYYLCAAAKLVSQNHPDLQLKRVYFHSKT